MTLNQNEERFLSSATNRQKFLILGCVLALAISILWLFQIDTVMEKVDFLRYTRMFQEKILTLLAEKTQLQFDLKDTALVNLNQYEDKLVMMVRYCLLISVSGIMLSISVWCFFSYLHNRRFLVIINKLRQNIS